MKIVFMGTPAFAVPSLKALTEYDCEVVGVVTQPDRPSGRGKKKTYSPVKEFALEHELKVLQPEKIREDGVRPLKRLAPDLCVTAAYGQILSQEVLDIPRLGTINVHASLLPRHRGSSPIAWSILQGDATVGVTTMMTNIGIDDGDMLLKREMSMPQDMTCGELTTYLSHVGATLLIETIKRLEEGTLVRLPQHEASATYDPMLKKEMGRIDWTEDARKVRNRIMAMNPWPTCSVPYEDGALKLLRAQEGAAGGQPGCVLEADAKKGLLIACGTGSVRVTEVQAPGGKAMPATDFLRGHEISVGTDLSATRE